MSIVAICSKCGRKGGYAIYPNDKMCARCRKGLDAAPRNDDEGSKDDKDTKD